MSTREQGAEHLWDAVWSEEGHLGAWDALSQDIWEFLEAALPIRDRMTVLEAGCGTGRISRRIADEGRDVVLVDISANALALARGFFAQSAHAPRMARADVARLPFRSESFDIVWNAGVMEHFRADERHHVLSEMARVCKPGGRVVTFIPNARAVIYCAAKRRAERTGEWIWGYEQPINSMREDFREAGLRLTKETRIAFQQELRFAQQFLTRNKVLLRMLDEVLHHVLRPLGRAGYLVASVGMKP